MAAGTGSIHIYSTDVLKDIDLTKMNLSSLTIGRDESNDIVIHSPLVSGKHARIHLNNYGRLNIVDLNSTNGTYLNGKFIHESIINPGDVIKICEFKITYTQNCLSISSESGVKSPGASNSAGRVQRKPATVSYPYYYQRSPRLIPELPGGVVEIPNPPAAKPKPTIFWLGIILSPIIMIIVMIVMAIFSKALYGLVMLPVAIGTISVSVLNYKNNMKKYLAQEQARKDKYFEALFYLRRDLQQMRDRQKDTLIQIHPAISACSERIARMDRKLWERTPNDSDFLTLRLGVGIEPFRVEIKAGKSQINMENDPLVYEPLRIAEDFKTVYDVPVCLPLFNSGTAGFVGERREVLQSARALITQIVTHHSYDEVKLIAIFPQEELAEWEWMKWLPHTWNENRQKRFIACEKASSHQILSDLHDILKGREFQPENSGSPGGIRLPYYIFLLGDMNLLENEPIMNYLSHNSQSLGVSSVFLFNRMEYLPRDCRVIVELASKTGKMINREYSSNFINFNPDRVQTADAEVLARRMSPIRIKQLSASTNIPNTLTLMQLFDKAKVEEIDVSASWKTNKPYPSMAVPFGVKLGNEKVMLDIHERGHGPHGLVAGTTGSGKSELLQSYIASLAVNFHPHDVAFVLIDYKGGGMANLFKDLPHLIGTITNLGGNQTTRALVSIQSELKKRQAILGEHGVNHIDSYQKLYHNKQADEPLPHLIIIVDEFAELKKEQPEFMRELVSAARVGRSLGVHLILATQKPAGVVDDQIWSNSKFKICLKVQDPGDSKEVIKRPDASNITLPGRAYLQVGNNEIFELLQSAWSGAPYSFDGSSKINTADISEVELDGRRRRLRTQVQSVESARTITQLEVLIKHIGDIAEKEGAVRLAGPWMPPLPEKLLLEDIRGKVSQTVKSGWNGEGWLPYDSWMCSPIGLLDNPVQQSQVPLFVDLGRDGHLSVYGSPGTGKTTFLQTLVTSLAMAHSPEELNIYILDFGGRTLNVFTELPHVGGVVMPDEGERVKKVLSSTLKIMDERKKAFVNNGVSSIQAYREVTGGSTAAVCIIIDNYPAFAENYPMEEDTLVQITREGGNLGIHVVLTCNSATGIRFKLTSNFKTAIALQMTDKSDYTVLVGRTGGLEPAPVNGRGLIRGVPPLEFQTALPVDGDTEIERTNAMKLLVNEMTLAWKGKRARTIPVIPDEVYLKDLVLQDDVIEKCSGSTLLVPIGLNMSQLETAFVDFNDIQHIIVAGQMQSGKTSVLRAILIQMAEKINPDLLNIYILDSRRMEFRIFKDLQGFRQFINTQEQLREAVTKIRDEVEAVKAEMTKARLENEDSFQESVFMKDKPRHIIVIDDFVDLSQLLAPDIKDIFDKLIRRERGMGFHMLVGGGTADIGGSYDPLAKALKENQTGFLMGTNTDQMVFSIKVNYGESLRVARQGEGFFISRGRYAKVKFAYLEETEIKEKVGNLANTEDKG